MLAHSSPAALGQSLRMKLAATPPSIPFIVVEGDSDKQSLAPWLSRNARLVPARGKELVLGSIAHLSSEELDRCTFIVDCDGLSDPSWFTTDHVITTVNRDIESDVALSCGALIPVLVDYTIINSDDRATAETLAGERQEFSITTASILGIVLDAARAFKLPVRLIDPHTGARRRFRATDSDEFGSWLHTLSAPSLVEMTIAATTPLGWTPEQAQRVLDRAEAGGAKSCRAHGEPGCPPCIARRFCNGHDLVDILAACLAILGVATHPREVARALRLAAQNGKLGEWHLIERLERRQTSTGRTILRTADSPGT